jgi:hypothetical protein
MRKIFVHLHIPKCGGSSVTDVLSRNFGPDLGTTNSILNDYQYDAAQVARILDHHPRLKCLTGHKLSLDLPFDRNDLDIQAFTWIRDPVDRFISHYFYHRNHTDLVPEAKSMGFTEYVDWALKYGNQKMYINGQTRFLSEGSVKTISLMVKEEKLLLFPLSKLQESLYSLARRFPDVFMDVIIGNKNVSRKDMVLPENLRQLVLPYVEEDMHLLALSRQTALETERPSFSKYVALRRNMALKTAHVLRYAASFVERR